MKSSLFKIYQNVLRHHPYTIQSIQTGILMGTGDIISQTLIETHGEHKHQYSFRRTASFFAIGTICVGPALTIWYRVLNRFVGTSGKTVVLKKVAIDQIIFAPLCLLSLTGVIKVLQGDTFEEVKEDIKKVYFDLLMANYKMWPLAQLINFYFVPLNFQVLYVQTLAVAWNSYLAFKTRPREDQ